MNELEKLRTEITWLLSAHPMVARVIKPALDAAVKCIAALDRRISQLEKEKSDD